VNNKRLFIFVFLGIAIIFIGLINFVKPVDKISIKHSDQAEQKSSIDNRKNKVRKKGFERFFQSNLLPDVVEEESTVQELIKTLCEITANSSSIEEAFANSLELETTIKEIGEEVVPQVTEEIANKNNNWRY